MANTHDVTLSVVDQSPMRKGGSPSEALRETVELAQFAESLGYARYWVAEHHNSTSFTGTSPEILIGQIAGGTERIRVGSGGVMLTHYSALKVAEQFRILDAFFPGRIDLGIGRAPGSDRLTAAALSHPRPPVDVLNQFPQMVGDLLGFLNGNMPEGHPLHEISAQPGETPNTVPDVWLLGSSDYSAQLAARLGLPFSFADFFGNTTEYGPRIAEIYRQLFQPSEYLSEPKVNATLQVVCAPTKDEARFIGSSRRINKVMSALGLTTGGMISPEEAMDWPLDDQAKADVEESSKGIIEGDPAQVREGILTAAERYQTADIGIVTNCYYFEQRKRSYKLVAEAMGVETAKISAGTEGES